MAEAQKAVAGRVEDWEIVVVDDFSTDGTREILQGLARPGLRVLLQERNQGKGASLRDGFAAVTGDVVIIQDADLEYNPREFHKLLKPVYEAGADVVYVG